MSVYELHTKKIHNTQHKQIKFEAAMVGEPFSLAIRQIRDGYTHIADRTQ